MLYFFNGCFEVFYCGYFFDFVIGVVEVVIFNEIILLVKKIFGELVCVVLWFRYNIVEWLSKGKIIFIYYYLVF